MYRKLLKISIILTLNYGAFASASYLPAEQNYHRMNMERNHKVNTGIWKRGKSGDAKIYHGDFLFPGAAQDLESLGNNAAAEFADGNSNNNMNDDGDAAAATFFSRVRRDVGKNENRNKQPCNGNEANCIVTTEKAKKVNEIKPEVASKLIPTSVLNEYPYEIAVLLNDDLNEIVKTENSDLKRNDVEFKVVPLTDGKDYVDIYVTPTDRIVDINEIYAKIKEAANHTINTIDYSRKHSDYDKEIVKNMVLVDNVNDTNDSGKLNRNVIMGIFNKNHQAWPQQAPKINGKNGEVFTPKGKSRIVSKTINEEGLIKVLSMLTKTFKKVMKQHEDIKNIHGKFHAVTNDFTKHIDNMTKNFEEFEEKYKLLIELNDKIDAKDIKLQDRYKQIEEQQRELAKNLAEFAEKQKKFMLQQKQFYDIQKTILAQNENINRKQTLIAKSQNIVSHKQNEFARIIQKIKKLYNARKSAKLNPNIKVKDQPKTTVTTTTAQPEKASVVDTTEPVKINLFSVPVKEKLRNQDEHILNEKDEQSIDDIVYKFYFNNTFIDTLLKAGVLASFVNEPNRLGRKDQKKRSKEDIEKLLEKTILVPVIPRAKSEAPDRRQRRWVKPMDSKDRRVHVKPPQANRFKFYDDNDVKHKKKSHKTAHEKLEKADTVTEKKTRDEAKGKEKKPYLGDANDPFRLMAMNFCNQIKHNANNQVLNWCIEKALRKLQAIDVKMSLVPLATDNHKHAAASDNVDALAKTIHTFRKFKPNESINQLVRTSTDLPPTPGSTDAGRSKADETTSPSTVRGSQDLSGMFFPDNDKLESNLKQFELVPDTEGIVYYDGSLHSSKMTIFCPPVVLPEDEAASDIMPGMDSNSHVDIDPRALEIQAQRRAYVRSFNEKILKTARST